MEKFSIFNAKNSVYQNLPENNEQKAICSQYPQHIFLPEN